MSETNSKTKTTKSKVLTSALAVALAALLLIGGASIAYLQDNTNTITNTFDNSNEVSVDIDESKTEFEIIPGTSETKDPQVTVDTTVAAYVYVVVDDNTQGLVTYSIDSGWTKLDGYDNVYYRAVDADTNETFDVLAGNTVSYDSSLTNEDLANASDVTLAFTAYAIQQASFTDAVEAYAQAFIGATVTVGGTTTAYSSLTEAIAANEGETVTVSGDSSVSASALNAALQAENTIDLDDNTLTVTGSSSITTNGNELTIENGELIYVGTNTVSIAVEEGDAVTLSDVDMTTTVPINVEQGTEDAALNIVDTTITSIGNYAVSTNASVIGSGANVVINITNSTLTVEEKVDDDYDSTALLFNIAGTVNITNSTLTAERQGAIIRDGSANITDSTIATTSEYCGGATHLTGRWGSGNEVPMAALVIGDNATAYTDDVTVNISNTTLTAPESTLYSAIPQIYAAANDGTTTTITSDTDYTITTQTDGTALTINGTTY
ncbi:MAG: hypothetical protein LUF33_00930 [Clostridiales bacterium]|nr:hypothetical protein [Clostridiales bacterium]